MEDRPALLEDFGAFYRAQLDVVLTFCMARVRDRELAAGRSMTSFLSPVDSRWAGLPEARPRVIVAYSEPVTATVLTGPDAPAALRRRLDGVIASLTFAALQPGTQVGSGAVLGPAGDYAVGSFTRTDGRFPAHRTEPIYVVHASVGSPPGTSARSRPVRARGCVLRHRRRLQHAAQPRPDLRHQVRWGRSRLRLAQPRRAMDRVGRVVSRPPDESHIGSIEGLYVKV